MVHTPRRNPSSPSAISLSLGDLGSPEAGRVLIKESRYMCHHIRSERLLSPANQTITKSGSNHRHGAWLGWHAKICMEWKSPIGVLVLPSGSTTVTLATVSLNYPDVNKCQGRNCQDIYWSTFLVQIFFHCFLHYNRLPILNIGTFDSKSHPYISLPEMKTFLPRPCPHWRPNFWIHVPFWGFWSWIV